MRETEETAERRLRESALNWRESALIGERKKKKQN